MITLSNKEIGQMCKAYRQSINKKQIDVSKDTGYSIESISTFENGRTNNMQIFVWYILHGFTFKDIN